MWKYPFKAGDIILSNGEFIPKLLTNNQWGHVGIVYQDPKSKILYVFDIALSVRDMCLANVKKPSTRLIPIYKYVKKCGAVCAVRSLSKEVDLDLFEKIIKKWWGQPFALDYFANGGNRVFQSIMGVPIFKRTKKSGRYCAEIISHILIELKVFRKDDHIPADHIMPKDFGADTELLPYHNEWRLGPEIRLYK